MADASQFYERWKLHCEIANECATKLPSAADWEIVFRFYACVHLVEGYLHTKSPKFWSADHAKRRRRFTEAPEIRSAEAAYTDLKDLSEQVRYDPGYRAPTEAFAHAKTWAAKVESVVKPKLERALGL